MAVKKKAESANRPEPTFSKVQLVNSKTLGISKDVLCVVLEDNRQYTKEQAISLASEFLERMV